MLHSADLLSLQLAEGKWPVVFEHATLVLEGQACWKARQRTSHMCSTLWCRQTIQHPALLCTCWLTLPTACQQQHFLAVSIASNILRRCSRSAKMLSSSIASSAEISASPLQCSACGSPSLFLLLFLLLPQYQVQLSILPVSAQ